MRALFVLAALLAATSAIGLLTNPYAGILLITLFKPVIDTAYYVVFGPNLSLTRLYGVLIPLLVFFHIITAKGAARIRFMPLRILWIIYAADVLFFSGIIVYHEGIISGSDVFFRHINGFIGFYMFQAFFHLDGKMKSLLLAMIFAGIFPIVTSLYQIVTGVQWHHIAQSLTEGGLVRSTGLYFHIATIRYYCYQALIGVLLYWSMFKNPGVYVKFAGIALLLAILITVYRTYSKAGYLEIFMWALIWLTFRKRYALLTVIIIAGFVLTVFFATDISSDIYLVFDKEIAAVTGGAEGEAALAGRAFLWQVIMARWEDLNPVLQAIGSGQVMTAAHNDYIMMLYHGGVFGLILYIALFGTIGVRIVRELMIKVEPLGIAALMLYLTFIVETVGLVPSSFPHFQWLVWGMVGLFLRRRQDEKENRDAYAEDRLVEDEPQKPRILQQADS